MSHFRGEAAFVSSRRRLRRLRLGSSRRLTLQGFARCRAGRAHFSTTNGSNFNKWGAASPQIFLAGIIRVHWGYSWFKEIRAG
jgi:hypothetical protein